MISTPMATPSHAVFLSYASDDAEAAQHIAEALRAAGIEVWFDREELRGGDAWDRRIRDQIHDCRLFIAVISAHTEARDEGYFRREWRLAVERAGDMAEDKAFVVPVAIDGTSERRARVPDPFKHVQWTRLPGGETPAAFVERIRRLLEPQGSSASAATTGVSARLTSVQTAGRLPTRPWRSRPVLWAIGAVLAAGLAYFAAEGFFWVSKRSQSMPPVTQADTSVTAARATAAAFSQSPPSIAILPFVDLSEKQDQKYFADGIAESLLDTLAKVPRLKVIGRTSSFQFRGKSEDLRSIGQRLNADYLVEGSVRRSNERTRVTAQLIDSRSGAHRWSDTFERDIADTFALQDQISAAIARELDIATTPVTRAHINPEAYEDLMRGMAEYDRGDWEPAVAHFRQALALEPSFIEAAEGITSVRWTQLTTVGASSAGGSWQKLQDAAQTVLRIDGHSAIGHAAMGAFRAGFEYDWPSADAELQAALANPSPGAEALSWIAWLANGLGHRKVALDLAATAVSLDPLNSDAYMNQGSIWLISSDFARAEEPLRKALMLSPAEPDVRALIATMYVLEHRPQDALTELALERSPGDREVTYAIAYDQLGHRAASDDALNHLLKDSDEFAYGIATVYAMRHDPDQAFSWLDRAWDLRSEALAMLVRTDPMLDGVRPDPRFRALLRKMKLSEQ